MSLTPYIKPTRYKHDSGYRMFECGYVAIADGNRPLKKYVIGHGADHVFTDVLALVEKHRGFGVNMDLTLNGYIRIWSNGYAPIRWQFEKSQMSSMELVLGVPQITEDQLETIA